MAFALKPWCQILRAAGIGGAALLLLSGVAVGQTIATPAAAPAQASTIQAAGSQSNAAKSAVPPGGNLIARERARGGISLAQQELAAGQTLGITFNPNTLTIASVGSNSPLASLGLRAGDQITALNGRPVLRAGDLLKQLSNLAQGDTAASLTVSRDGAQQVLNVSSNVLDGLAQAQINASTTAANSSNDPANQNATLSRQNFGDTANSSTRFQSQSVPRTSAANVLRDSLHREATQGSSLAPANAASATTINSASAGTASIGTGSAGTAATGTVNAGSGAAITQSGTGLIAPNAGVALPPGTITPPTINPANLPPGSFGNETTTSNAAPSTGATSTGATATTTTPATTSAAAGTGSGAEISQSSTGLIAPNAGVALPPGTITPPTINPANLPPGSFGNETATPTGATGTNAPPTTTTGAAAGTGSGAAIGQSSTGLIAPNAGVAVPPGTITPPTINPSQIPATGADNVSSGTPAVAAPAPANALPTTVLTPSGPRIVAPQQGGVQARASAGATGGITAPVRTPATGKAAPAAKAGGAAKGGAKGGVRAGGGGVKAGAAASGGAATGT